MQMQQILSSQPVASYQNFNQITNPMKGGRPAAMARPATCCCASSISPRGCSGGLVFPSAPPPFRLRLRLRLSLSAAAASEPPSPPPPPPLEDIGFEIEVCKAGTKRNRRVVRARVRVDAPLEAVWATLTDYEGLADFIPGLAECRLLEQAEGFARLYQVGEQDLALGFKFNAKGTIDCYEGAMMESSLRRRREIAFNMIDGDFKLFQGKWSVEEDEFQTTTLSYAVELEPKLWVPVKLLEGRICSEIKNNLVSIRQQAQRRTTTALQHE